MAVETKTGGVTELAQDRQRELLIDELVQIINHAAAIAGERLAFPAMFLTRDTYVPSFHKFATELLSNRRPDPMLYQLFIRELELSIRSRASLLHSTVQNIERSIATYFHKNYPIIADYLREAYNHIAIDMERVTARLKAVAADNDLSVAELQQAIDNYKAAKAGVTARDKPARAKEQPRPEAQLPPSPPSPRVRAVFGEVSALRTKSHKRRNLPAEVMDDPEVIEAAKVIVNAHRYTPISALDDEAAEKLRKARAIVRRQERSLAPTP